MNNFFCFISVLFFLSCNGQKNKVDDIAKDTTYSLSKEKMTEVENKSIVELYIAKYVDSLNIASSENELPQFLNNSQFDYGNKGAWESLHNPISVRDQIISRVTNCKALQLVINSRNENFRMIPHVEDDLIPPFIKLSFYDLVVKRIESLNCK